MLSINVVQASSAVFLEGTSGSQISVVSTCQTCILWTSPNQPHPVNWLGCPVHNTSCKTMHAISHMTIECKPTLDRGHSCPSPSLARHLFCHVSLSLSLSLSSVPAGARPRHMYQNRGAAERCGRTQIRSMPRKNDPTRRYRRWNRQHIVSIKKGESPQTRYTLSRLHRVRLLRVFVHKPTLLQMFSSVGRL